VRESFEVQRKASALRSAVEPLPEIIRILCGKLGITLIASKLNDRLGAKSAVKMIVEDNFGERTEDAFRQFHGKGGPFSVQN
jgi:hypothetical protein